MARDEDPPRNPLLDPRLAGAGGLLITVAALAFLLTHAGRHDPAPVTPVTPVPPRTSVTATR
ncbi:hypothetical protein [Streptacidiphilus jiangxiensis]|uniref:Uncharacterized protein n=1 Tax=Streptacidiphilus jiangxiensis TaxID=235985 RepID=A0A1H7SBJ8_STRJI|nr:hypothetical protein [Streptacidiphilus jiangxiensis]SEL68907.1 hypothetical protein SAMN05414137_111226 [Streptacidiphilus jiangxiensis]